MPTLVFFEAGAHGKAFGERGWFCFWTAMLRQPKGKKIWGRALSYLPAGDRFDRMKREQKTAPNAKARKVYADFWNKRLRKGAGIVYIRPSSRKEVQHWCDTHQSDAKHITFKIIGGKPGCG